MAISFFTGFETGIFAGEVNSSGGTFSVQSNIKRSGDYSLRCNPTTTNTGYVQVRTFGTNGNQSDDFNSASLYTRFYFFYTTKPSANSEPIFISQQATSDIMKLEVRINSNGNIEVYDQSISLVSTGSTVLSANTWYRIEVKSSNGTSGEYEVKINGISEVSGTCDQIASNIARVVFGKRFNRNSQTIDVYFDDISISKTEYPGAGSCLRMDADGNGNYTAWTGAYTDVDDVLPDDDTTYITSSTTGEAETVSLESASNAGIQGIINAVRSVAVVRDEGGTSAIQVRLRSGTTDNDTGSNDPGSTYIIRSKLYTTNPANSLAWSVSDLDSIEVGVENNANVAVRCTALHALVDFSNGPPVITLSVSAISVSTVSGGTPSNIVDLFPDITITDPETNNLTATLVIADITKSDIYGSLPSGWSGSAGSYSCTSRTPSQMQTDLLSIAIEGLITGSTTATLTISDGDLTDQEVITIQVVEPDLSVSVSNGDTFDIGNINVNTSGSQQFTLYNNGAASLEIGVASISGTGFSISGSDNPSSTTILVGDSTTVTVDFQFLTSGIKTGILSIPSNDPDSPYIINLTANAIGETGQILYADLIPVSSSTSVLGGNQISTVIDSFQDHYLSILFATGLIESENDMIINGNHITVFDVDNGLKALGVYIVDNATLIDENKTLQLKGTRFKVLTRSDGINVLAMYNAGSFVSSNGSTVLFGTKLATSNGSLVVQEVTGSIQNIIKTYIGGMPILIVQVNSKYYLAIT